MEVRPPDAFDGALAGTMSIGEVCEDGAEGIALVDVEEGRRTVCLGWGGGGGCKEKTVVFSVLILTGPEPEPEAEVEVDSFVVLLNLNG